MEVENFSSLFLILPYISGEISSSVSNSVFLYKKAGPNKSSSDSPVKFTRSVFLTGASVTGFFTIATIFTEAEDFLLLLLITEDIFLSVNPMLSFLTVKNLQSYFAPTSFGIG